MVNLKINRHSPYPVGRVPNAPVFGVSLIPGSTIISLETVLTRLEVHNVTYFNALHHYCFYIHNYHTVSTKENRWKHSKT